MSQQARKRSGPSDEYIEKGRSKGALWGSLVVPHLVLTEQHSALVEEEVKVEIVAEIELDVELLAIRGKHVVGGIESSAGIEELGHRRLHRARKLRLGHLVDATEEGAVFGDLEPSVQLSVQRELAEVERAMPTAGREDALDRAGLEVVENGIDHDPGTVICRDLFVKLFDREPIEKGQEALGGLVGSHLFW